MRVSFRAAMEQGGVACSLSSGFLRLGVCACYSEGMSSLLTSQAFVVVDIETTGLAPPGDGITEIAALRIQKGSVTDRYVTLVNPGRAIPYQIQQLTGITNAMVQNAPRIQEVMPEFEDFCELAPIVAHNSSFDRRFLDHFARETLGSELINADVCTVRLARRLLPHLKSRSLGPLTQHLGISIKARHRAMGDAEATAEVFLRFLRQLDENGVQDLAALMAFQQTGRHRRSSGA